MPTCPRWYERMRSPGWSACSDTLGKAFHWLTVKCAIDTPACAHAHIVRPEQSKARPGLAAPKTYGTPSWLSAARTAMAAPGDVAGTAKLANWPAAGRA